MAKHLPLPVDAGHFDRWLELFEQTAREVCPPEAETHFVERARRIASSLELGIAGAQGVMLGNGERFRRNQAGAP
jgi:hemoglobin